MKKIMILFFALICLLSAKNVFAQEEYKLTLEKQDGIFMSRKGVNYDDDSHPYYIYKMNDRFVYCIEPGKHISTYTYVGNSEYIDLPFSNELKEKLELIGYYGRDYPGHNNVRYSMAAQALIWELTGVDTVTFWTKLNEQGEEINISKERNEIMNLVNNHKTLPSFKTSYTAYLKKELIITDTNKVLSNYEIESSGVEAYIDNNTLHIIPNKVGSYNISLKRKSYDEYNTIIFVGKGDNSSQKLGLLHFNKEIKSTLKINVSGISLLVQKKDENNQSIKISNIKFKVKDLKNNMYICDTSDCIYKTNSQGLFIVGPLDYGEYEIEEVEDQLINGYSWNKEKLHVTLNSSTSFKYNDTYHNYLELDFINNSVLGTLELYKKAERLETSDNVSYKEVGFINVKFDLYTNDNELIKTITTGKNGYVKVDNLKIGKYYLKERINYLEYIELDKIPFEIKQDNQYQTSINVELTVVNRLKKGRLEFYKVDSKTNKGIPNTIIEIYNNANTLLYTRETDKDGKVIIDNLAYGKYYIKEKQANYYYSKSDEIINFEIKENNEVIKKTMINDKILGKLIIEKHGEELLIKNNDLSYKDILLKDIEFELYNDNNELIDVIKTNEDGYIEKELELGKYYIVERNTLENYIDNDNKIYFEIKKDDNKAIDVKLEINNFLKKGSVEFTKEELLTHKLIDNTVMELYNENNELLLTKKTDLTGKIIINDLPVGKYYFKEKKANYYFQITDEIVNFEIKENVVTKTKLTNKKIVGNLKISKFGEKYQVINEEMVYESNKLANIEFNIYDNYNKLITTIKTDELGNANYTLPLGKYYIIEKTKLDNYIDNNDKIYFEIKKDDNKAIDVKLYINNYLKKGNLEFTKEDLSTSIGIPNTIIEIYDEHNNLWFTKETDNDGKVYITNLPIGKYYIIEKEANSMYLITNEKVFFEIKDNGEIVKANMTNEKKEIPVPKTYTNEGNIVNSLFGISLLISLGRMYYERKKSY